MNRATELQKRNVDTKLEVRKETDGDIYLEGYFITFNKETELWPGAYEEIAPTACDETLSNDIRALINHDTTLVIGRNKARTLELKADAFGLWGSVKINQDDSDAINAYHRVERGDVSGNSFGGYFPKETFIQNEDGSVKWRVETIDLREVSVCTFPQYEDTTIQARERDFEQYKNKQLEQRKTKLKERLKNAETANAK